MTDPIDARRVDGPGDHTMTDPLDLDAIETRSRGLWYSRMQALNDLADVVAELRTARAERDAIAAEKKQLRGHASELIVLRDALRAERDALAARIEAAVAVVHVMFLGHGEGPSDLCDRCADRERLRAALSGATEPTDTSICSAHRERQEGCPQCLADPETTP